MAKSRFWILIASLALLACRPNIPKDPATLTYAIGADPDTLNPITSTDATASEITGLVNDSLIERDRDTLEFKPKLAERWEVSSDHLTYTFYLRKDVTWHDGKPFTADDVVYSYKMIQNPSVDAPSLRGYYKDITKIEKLDAYTVRFTYAQPYFLALSFCGGIPIVPKHIFAGFNEYFPAWLHLEIDEGKAFNSHPTNRFPIGTGPYQFVEWKTGSRVVLKRYENYYDKKPAIARIVMRIYSNPTAAFESLKKGDLDFGNLMPIQWVKQSGSENFNRLFTKYTYPSPGYGYIGWNMKNPLFTDRRVRLAMTHMINREKVLEKINFGLGNILESPFFSQGVQYNHNLKTIPFDPEAAKKLLTEAGFKDTDGDGFLDKDGKKFAFTFLYPSESKAAGRMAPIMKEDFKKIGIEMNIEQMEWSTFLLRIKKKEFDATRLGWSTGFEDDPYQIWHSSQSKAENGSNFVSFENAEADKLIEQARSEFDPEKRKVLYDRFQEIIYNEQPYTFLFETPVLMAVSKRFKNVLVHKTGLNFLEWTVE